MTTNIVQINVSQTVAPTPDRLQQTGAMISQGGTNTATGTSTLLTQKSDLTAILAGAKTISSMSYSTGTVSVTTSTAHGFVDGEVSTITGVTPSGYNGTYTLTVTGASTFTYSLGSNPGVVTVQGVVTDEDVTQLTAMVNTFFAQGSNTAVYVLELGHGTPADGVADLDAYITANPNAYYEYLVPRLWDEESTFVDLCNSYTSTTSKLYFFATVQESTYADFANLKSVVMTIESPDAPSTEFTAASNFYWMLSQKPSSTNKVPPAAFGYRQGVTVFDATPTQATAFKAGNVNYITTGAEGGISNKMVKWGVMADGRPMNYWYSVDWVQINMALFIANEIINGSNTSISPLYYDQAGINRLRNKAVNVMNQAVSRGLALGNVKATNLTQEQFIENLNDGDYAGNVVVNSVPFAPYNAANPTHYALGEYDGLSAVYTPLRGFEQIIFNINVTDFVA